MAQILYDHVYLPRKGRFGRKVVFNLVDRLSLMMSVARERRQLRSLSLEALKDMGLHPADVNKEIARPLWDLPKNRLV